LRPTPSFDDVFERDVVLDGHTFALRPRWSPRSLKDVPDAEVKALQSELDFGKDGTTEMFVATATGKSSFIEGMIDDIGGVELTPRLGEKDKQGSPQVPPLVTNAYVPQDVDFYRAARHPWTDVETSWRYDGFTQLSQELFERKYKEAEKEISDPEGTGGKGATAGGNHPYWPTKEVAEGVVIDKDEALLKDRYFNVLKSAEGAVEKWARDLRSRATSTEEAINFPLETTTVAEKIFDDEYYRWFIQPGVHPNPSGVIRGGATSAASSSQHSSRKMDIDIEKLLESMALAAPVEEGGAAAGTSVVIDADLETSDDAEDQES
jgi:hypothetical protein